MEKSEAKRFEIYLDGRLIGHSALEKGDAPMGVAFGRLLPNSAYRRDLLTESSVINAKLGETTIPSVGAYIEDYFEELGEIEVTILVIGYPLYQELFPEHVTAYKAQWRNP